MDWDLPEFPRLEQNFEINEGNYVNADIKSSNLTEPSISPHYSQPFIPCELILKGHWLEVEGEDNLASSQNNFPVQPARPHETQKPDVISGNKVFRCMSCTFTCEKQRLLKNHEKVHLGNVFRCSSCDFQTNLKRNLARHELNHSDKKKYACDKCDYQNNSKVLFNKHKLNHSDKYKNSKFKCPICSFASDERESWKTHVTTHDRVRLHECDLCGYATTKLSDIKRHRMTHAKSEPPTDTPECTPQPQVPQYYRPQPIPRRDYSNGGPENKQFKCNLCSYASNLRGALRRHSLIHEETKALKCSDCDYRTNFKNRLRDHQKVHLQRKDYKCPSCQFETKHKLSLSRHILKYHRNS